MQRPKDGDGELAEDVRSGDERDQEGGKDGSRAVAATSVAAAAYEHAKAGEDKQRGGERVEAG